MAIKTVTVRRCLKRLGRCGWGGVALTAGGASRVSPGLQPWLGHGGRRFCQGPVEALPLRHEGIVERRFVVTAETLEGGGSLSAECIELAFEILRPGRQWHHAKVAKQQQ